MLQPSKDKFKFLILIIVIINECQNCSGSIPYASRAATRGRETAEDLARRDVAAGDALLAEDIAQETWLGLLRGLEGFEGRAALRTWLFQICANRARSMAAREQRVIPVDPDQFTADFVREMVERNRPAPSVVIRNTNAAKSSSRKLPLKGTWKTSSAALVTKIRSQ